MINKLRLFLALTLCSVSVFAEHESAETVRVLTYPIPLMVESESKGVFIDLINAIGNEANIPISIEVKNPPRALRAFSAGEYHVLMPALDTLFTDMQHVLRSEELFYIKRDFVFTLKNKPVIDRIEQLRGLRVGLTSAYPYARELLDDADIDLVFVDTDEQNAMLLKKGRIDAFIVEESSGIQAFRNTGLIGEVHYSRSTSISQQDVYFAIYNDERGAKLERQISQALARLKRSGLFEQIMTGTKTGL